MNIRFTLMLLSVLTFISFCMGRVPLKAEAVNIYFGDIHAHTAYSYDGGTLTDCDAVGSADVLSEFFRNARDVNGLDFVAITDHGEHITQEDLDAMAAAVEANQTASFIPFVGYEWTSSTYGHRTVVFKNPDQGLPLYSSLDVPQISQLWSDFESAGMAGYVYTLPHHPAGGPAKVDWSYHNEKFQPLVEIYSEFGSFEDCGDFNPLSMGECSVDHTVQAALNMGHKLGIFAGTDSHDTDPGSVETLDTCMAQAHHPYKGGLIAVIAPELTRDDIWRAIRNKRVYGTSGPRIILRFRINDNGMGSSISIEPGGAVNIYANAEPHGDGAVIETYEIIKDGQVIYTGADTVDYTDSSFTSDGYYYVRVTQRNADGTRDRAWSSPIWVSLSDTQTAASQ